jgi:spore germination protein GerM
MIQCMKKYIILLIIVLIGIFILSNKQDKNIETESPQETEETIVFNVYFNDLTNDPNVLYCASVYAVQREVLYTQAVGMAALEQLILGPTEEEKAEDYVSSIDSEGEINSLVIKDGVAYVDTNQKFWSVGGSCGSASARSSLVETLKQFPTVSEVVITVEGVPFEEYGQGLI